MWDAGFYFFKYFYFFSCRICSFHVFELCHIFFFLKLFKLPLEKEGQVGGPILAQEEIKTIFGSIPDIYDVHTRIKVLSVRVQRYLIAFSAAFIVLVFFNQSDLEELLTDWSENRSVGNIILKYVSSSF